MAQALARPMPLALAMAVEGEEGFGGQLGGSGPFGWEARRDIRWSAAKDLLAAAHPAFATHGAPRRFTTPNSSAAARERRHRRSRASPMTRCSIRTCLSRWPPATRLRKWSCAGWRGGFRIRRAKRPSARGSSQGCSFPEMSREDLKNLYDQIELPLAEVLADVEAAGVQIDPNILAGMSGEFDKELTALTREIYDLAGEPFDIESPKQLGEILFEKTEAAGRQAAEEERPVLDRRLGARNRLAERHELPRKIIEYRTRAKLKSTYVDALPTLHQSRHGPPAHQLQSDGGAHGPAFVLESESPKHSHRR